MSDPQHYTRLKPEPIDVIESWGLNFRLANALKYIARADHKGQRISDLEKCIWYVNRELEAAVRGEGGEQNAG